MEPEGKFRNITKKEDLWKENHPIIKAIREIPEIIENTDPRYEQVVAACIPLKQLFEREQMDRYHVDCLVLYQIALGTLHILEELRLRKIYPGIYDLAEFYVDLRSGNRVALTHPEHFGLLTFEQDYECYPEDLRLFPDTVVFDENSQKLADSRLIYKILIASPRGNVKIPPRQSETDYSSLFYKTLPPELKELFLSEKGADHQQLKDLINEAIEVERESAREVGARYQERLRSQAGVPVTRPGSQEETQRDGKSFPYQQDFQQNFQQDFQQDFQQGGLARELGGEHLYTMFVLLRCETAHSARISKMLYMEQDRLELDAKLTKSTNHQAFVYGNGFVEARDFQVYPEGFRISCQQGIREYSSAEAITIACELMRDTMNQLKDGSEKNRTNQDDRESGISTPDKGNTNNSGETEFRICLITDGRLKNDQVFGHALMALTALKNQGCKISFICDRDSRCEACEKLQAMVS